MNHKLSRAEYLTVASMLFGLFFGAGNLIFPVQMGQLAGRNVWAAAAGFLVTGVSLPLLGVAALGVSRCSGLFELSGRLGRRYGLFFTCALYLTIGPFFAIPRCATVSFSVGIRPMLDPQSQNPLPLAVFSAAFFLAVLWFSLRPSGILTWVGKVLNPIFLASLAVLMVTALCNPIGSPAQIEPDAAYASDAFFTGFLEGYNTMDALASLAFGIIVVEAIRSLGVTDPGAVAASTVRAGALSGLLMAVIYVVITLAGAQSRGLYPVSADGGEALSVIAHHYFGPAGAVILAITVTFACLKTAVGLITSCAETFCGLFGAGPAYRTWTVLFCAVSLLIANFGLETIIAWSVPVLMFLYPLAITLILLSLAGGWFGNDPAVLRWVTGPVLVAAAFDFLKALPAQARAALRIDGLVEAVGRLLPFFSIGLGWVLPALFGLAVGLLLRHGKNKAGA